MWTREAVDLYFEAMNESLKLDSSNPSLINIGDAMAAVDSFNEYLDAWEKRTELEARYPGSSIFDGMPADKKLWNESMSKITSFERKAVGTPIYDKLIAEHGEEMFKPWPNFMELPDQVQGSSLFRRLEPGWYQNLRAELFHYNGDVWDRGVPDERDEELEFLGGK